MEKIFAKYRVGLCLLAITGTAVLCTPLATDASLAYGFIMAKVYAFQRALALFAVGLLVCLFLAGKQKLAFTWADGWMLGLGLVVFFSYDKTLNPEPEKCVFGGLLIAFWFMMRYAVNAYPFLRLFFLSVLLCTGLGEALWGIGQLYGWSASHHSLFRLTGSFFNPGPYSGYLAVLLPVCLGMILKTGKYKNTSQWKKKRGVYVLAGVCLGVICTVLPAGMSRSAWGAAVVSCGWVYWQERIGWRKSRVIWHRYRRKAFLGLVVTALLFITGSFFFYHLKKESADGRLLMWKVTAQVFLKSPFRGTGLGGFPAAYADAQARYFASGQASKTEIHVAGCPEYAFNEYLQMGVEEGAWGLLAFMGWIGCCFYYAFRGKAYEICGGILAFLIFAFSSYPLQLPSFAILLVFLGACFPPPARSGSNYCLYASAGIAVATCLLLVWTRKGEYKNYQAWNKVKILYQSSAYQLAREGYQKLYEPLKHRPEFLFEGAQCLAKTGRPEEANRWLARAARLSADPMLHDVMARNEQALGRYEEAERHLLYAADVLPERIYPYYLLVKLYAEPAFCQPEKMEAAARQVLEKRVKVESTAVREMREEVTAIRLRAARQEIPGE